MTGAAPGSGLGGPFQKAALREGLPVPDLNDGIQAHRRLMRQQSGIGGCPHEVVDHLGQIERAQSFAGRGHGQGLGQGMKKELQTDHHGGQTTDSRGNQPGGQQQRQAGGGQQAAAQVVENLPPVEQGKGIGAATAVTSGNAGENPGRDLPVAPNPAMGAFAVTLVALRKFIKEFNVAGQPHPDMGPFDQIMAQDPFFRKPSRQDPAEGTNIIDAFAMVRAFAA